MQTNPETSEKHRMLEKAFLEDIDARIRNLQKIIDADPPHPHKDYFEGQLSAYRYVVAMVAEIEIRED